MEIYLRIPKGWSKPVLNRSMETCDGDGARLWIGPGNQIYCDQEHDLETVAQLPKPAEKIAAIKYYRQATNMVCRGNLPGTIYFHSLTAAPLAPQRVVALPPDLSLSPCGLAG